jgi:hypothetical protein
VRPGVATCEQTGEDQVTLSWEGPDGSLAEVDMSLREAANLQAGQPVSGYGRGRRFSPVERRVGLVARNDQIRERMGELEDQYPQLREPPEGGDEQHP